MLRLTIPLILAFAACGCGDEQSRVKGRLVENGQPVEILGGSTPQTIVFESLAADGKTASGRMYSAIMNPDGTFELVSAGGSIPPGSYRVSFDVTIPGKVGEKFKRFRGADSPLRKELKPGSNDFTIDLAKSEG